MNDVDFDLDDAGTVTLEVSVDEEDFGCDDVRPAWLGAELLNLDADTQIGFNAVFQDR